MSSPNVIAKFRYSLYENSDIKLSKRRQFYSSGKKDDYLGYMDKGSTSDTNKSYLDYMNDNQKSFGVFDKDGLLTSEQKKKLREMLRNTKSPIWDIVLSFEKEYGKKHVFNYQQAYDLLNYVLPKLFKDAGFGVDNVYWFAGLHQNTDNPHIHISFFQYRENNYKHHLKRYDFRKGKVASKYINQFKLHCEEYFDTDYQKFKVEERELQRLVKIKIADNSMEDYDNALKIVFQPLFELLPTKGHKYYDSKNMKPYRAKIDEVTTTILETGPYAERYFKLLADIDECDSNFRERCNKYHIDPDGRILLPKFQQELYRRLGNAIIKKVIDERDKAYEDLQHIRNENFRRKQELNQMNYLLSKSIELAKQVDEEAYEVFLEYRWKMKEAELNRLIEEGLISKEELEVEM